MTEQPDLSPFGADTQKYWERRREYFERFDDGIVLDAEGLYSVMPEDAAIEQARRIRSSRVLDAFTGVGGNAIGFAREGKSVVAVDTNPERLAMAASNAKVYGVSDRITFAIGDALEHINTFDGDAVYLDPPWGGPDYKSNGPFHLSYFEPNGRLLLDRALARFDEVALRVPRTFEVNDLASEGRDFEVVDDFSRGRLVSRTVYFS